MSEKILEMPSNVQFKNDYIRYGIYILYRRVLSDYRDGLKPVQRRILWAMYKNSKAIGSPVKSAAVIGDVIKYYHPHSDCLDGDTKLYCLDNLDGITIKEAYEKNIKYLYILAVDPSDGKIVATKATNFRIGQYADKEYLIHLSNGFTLKCTSNHPILMHNMEWVKAEDIKIGSMLYSTNISTSENSITISEDCIKCYSHPYFNIFDKIISSGKELSSESYFEESGVISYNGFNVDHWINVYKNRFPYVESVDIIDVDKKPMYDFTVNNLENMLIPIKSNTDNEKDYIKFISVHNSAIYGTMKPLVNWFETYIPMIDATGNFGTFQGDKQAAQRYTECKLSKFALENVLGDVMDSPEAVDWSPSYNEATKEPDYLPVKIPLLLVNGSFGIGLGMRAEIPTHNLGEVIDATLTLMDNPDAEVVLVPDHCMECEIIKTDFAKICKSGFGHYRIRSKIDTIQYKNKTALAIRSIPNLTYLNNIIDKIEDLVRTKKIIQIDRCDDETNVNGINYIITLKPGSDPNYVKEVLYKNTDLEQTLRINFETLNGFNPLRMSYKSYLLSFIDFRKMTKFRVYSNKLQAIQTKIHERESYIKLLESGEIDNVISIIKKQKVVDDSYLIEYLIKKLKITDLQAKYIIEADLKKLSYGYLSKYKSEAVSLEKEKQELLTHIMDDKIIENDIRQELIDIKNKYAKPRNCVIIEDTNNDIPKGEMVIAITEKNYIKKVPGGSNLGNFRNDTIRSIITLDNTDSIIIFDDVGKVFKLPVHKIPFTDKNSNGVDIRFIIKSLTANINTIIPESVLKNLASKGCHNNKYYLVTLTNSGLIKRMDLDDFTAVPPSGIIYAKLDAGDFIRDITVAHSNFNIVVYSDRKAVVMNVNDAPYLKRNTKGSRSMANVDHVDGLCVIHNNCTDIAVITESGKINRINIVQGLPNTGKGKSGCNLIKLASGDKITGVVSGNENDLIHIQCTENDVVLRFADLKIGSSISAGDKIVATRSNKIIKCYIERS